MRYVCYDERLQAAVESGSRKLVEMQALRRLAEDPDDFFGLTLLSTEHLLRGRYEDSERCSWIVALGDDDEAAALGWFLLSRCAHAQNEMDEAVARIYRAFTLSPDCNLLFSWAALYHLVRKEYALALAFANKVLQQEPEEILSLGIRVLAAFLDGGIEASEEHLDSIMAIDPESPISCYYRGRLEQERHRHDRARYWFTKALELEPESLWSQNALAMLNSDSNVSGDSR